MNELDSNIELTNGLGKIIERLEASKVAAEAAAAEAAADARAAKTAVYRQRLILLWVILPTAIVGLLFLLPQFWGPFFYTNHGLARVEYCPGDNLELWFAGRTDGTGRNTVVSGTLRAIDGGTANVVAYDPYTSTGRGLHIPQTYDFIPFNTRKLPNDLPPGHYYYTHSNTSGSGVGVNSITFSPIKIMDCTE